MTELNQPLPHKARREITLLHQTSVEPIRTAYYELFPQVYDPQQPLFWMNRSNRWQIVIDPQAYSEEYLLELERKLRSLSPVYRFPKTEIALTYSNFIHSLPLMDRVNKLGGKNWLLDLAVTIEGVLGDGGEVYIPSEGKFMRTQTRGNDIFTSHLYFAQ